MAAADPVLIVTGPPGAGKTATAAALARSRERAVHLESDAFFHFIASGYLEPWLPESHEQNELVMGIVAEAAARYARAGYLTIVDGIVMPRWFLGRLRDSLQAAGLAAAYAVLRPPLEVCLERAADRAGGPDVVARLWGEFAELDELERHVIDPGELSAEHVAALVAEHQAAGRLAL